MATSPAAPSLTELGKKLALPAPSRRPKRWRREELPEFLIIGGQKCGTSWMFKVLAEHPRIFLPATKELQYFNRPDAYEQGRAAYLAHFADARRRHILGEATPNYLWASDYLNSQWDDSDPQLKQFRFHTPERVRDMLGDNVRLVVLLRDPVERAVSAFFHHLTVEGRLDPDLAFTENARRRGIVHMGFYAAHLERWLEVFDPANLLVLINEEVRADPVPALHKVYRHLGVSDHVPASLHAQVHTGVKHGDDRVWYWDEERTQVAIGADELAQLREIFAPENDRFAELFGYNPWPYDDVSG